jgi:REP element-mobilizing transposase RayT
MSVWRRFPDHGYPSLLTTNVEDRRPIFRDGLAAEMLLEVIGEVQHEEAFELHSYVIMPDHVHLVVALPIGRSLGRIVKLIKGPLAWRYNRAKGATGKVWQDRYHERGLQVTASFMRRSSMFTTTLLPRIWCKKSGNIRGLLPPATIPSG